MTAKAALCKALLDGRTLNVKNCFETIGLTNCSREISRMVEQPFDVEVTRIHREGRSRYDQSVVWIDYKLLHTEENAEGIKNMWGYVRAQLGAINPTTTKQEKLLKKAGVISEDNDNLNRLLN